MAAPRVSQLHSLDISNGKVCGMVWATQDVLLCGNRLEKRTRQLCTRGPCRYLPAGTEPGVRNKPIRIVSGHVVIDREMALRPRGVCYLVAFSHYIFEPQTPFTGRDRQSVFTDGGVFYKAPGGFCVTT